MKGVVASGHPLTTEAACEILRRGGNAFDAALAAGFAATVTEPCLASLGGGGFLLVHIARDNQDVLYDFFVNAPGVGRGGTLPRLDAVDIKFKSTSQVFHVGPGSVAVPGVLKGFIKCHGELSSLDIVEITEPARVILRKGVEVNEFQRCLIEMLMPILMLSDYGKEMYGGLDRGGKLFNPLYGDFLDLGSPEQWLDIMYGDGAGQFASKMQDEGGLPTARDLSDYRVIERRPLSFPHQEYEVLTNPRPSSGGPLLAGAFSSLSKVRKGGIGETERLFLLADIMEGMNRVRLGSGGTTHISVLDDEGNAASLTFSNGSNSGVFFLDTGIMLNNMMGEDDLFPGGFFTLQPGERVSSMMSPAVVKRGAEIFAVLGSGGSKRIRTAMFQVMYNLMERGMDVRAAVEAPRMHLEEGGMLQMEPGFHERTVRAIADKRHVNLWEEKDLYFGGVHTVMGDFTGHGDSRRGGCFMRVE